MTVFTRARFFFVVPALVACLAQAQAPEWKEVFKNTEKTVSIKVDSVQRTKRGVQAWIKREFSIPLEIEELKAQATEGVEKAEYSHDRKWSLRILMYDAAGKQVQDYTPPSGKPGRELVPGTLEALIAEEVWALAPKGKKGTAAKTAR